MAMIDCPECAQQVSEHAPTCPTCGHPIRQQQVEQNAPQPVQQPYIPQITYYKGGSNHFPSEPDNSLRGYTLGFAQLWPSILWWLGGSAFLGTSGTILSLGSGLLATVFYVIAAFWMLVGPFFVLFNSRNIESSFWKVWVRVIWGFLFLLTLAAAM